MPRKDADGAGLRFLSVFPVEMLFILCKTPCCNFCGNTVYWHTVNLSKEVPSMKLRKMCFTGAGASVLIVGDLVSGLDSCSCLISEL